MNKPDCNDSIQAPGIMQIITAVSRAAGLSIAEIMGNSRAEHLIRARAAVCKIASNHGYDMPEIMDFINLNRTVGYNYKAKLEGHLKMDPEFISMYREAEIQLAKLPARAIKAQRAKEGIISKNSQRASLPKFRPYKSPLGWTFTAKEMKSMYLLEIEAEEYMANYDKQKQAKTSKNKQKQAETRINNKIYV